MSILTRVMGGNNSATDASGSEKKRKWLRQGIEIVVLTLVLYLALTASVGTARVDGTSMLPTLQNQDLLITDKLSYRFHSPARGDIIIFLEHSGPTNNADRYLVKRIIGLPGDIIEMENTYKDPRYEFAPPRSVVLVKPGGKGPWQRLDESYLQGTWAGGPNDVCCTSDGEVSTTPTPVQVPPGHFFVLGDNRDNSRDSRFIGFIAQGDIVGRAVFRLWPFGSLGLVGGGVVLEPA